MNLSLAHNKMALNNADVNNPRRLTSMLMMVVALAAFVSFNYSTTQYALRSLLGSIPVIGIHWAGILALAFCCIDIAGITRLFIPNSNNKTKGDHYLFLAWLLAAGVNALLTWRGIVVAINMQQTRIGLIVQPDILTKTIPLFLVLLIWLIRILIIGSLSRDDHPLTVEDQVKTSLFYSSSDPLSEGYTTTISNFPNVPIKFERYIPVSKRSSARREPTYRSLPIHYKSS